MDDDVRCGLKEAWCVCDLKEGHDGPHECHRDSCGGSWTFDANGQFVLVRFPEGSDEG